MRGGGINSSQLASGYSIDNNGAVDVVDADLDAVDADLMEEPPPPTPIRLPDEHLQLIFELRQKMDDQAHIQQFLGQCLDLLFDVMTTTPASKQCPTCGQIFVPAYNAHGGRARAHTWTSSPRLMFLFWFSQLCRELKFSIKLCKTVGHGHCSVDHYDLFCQLDILTVMSKQLQLHLIFDSHLSWFPSCGRTGGRLLIL
jgi:hypothetical protein